MSSSHTKRFRCYWKYLPQADWEPETEIRGVVDVEAADRDWAIVAAKKAAYSSHGVSAAHVNVHTIEALSDEKSAKC